MKTAAKKKNSLASGVMALVVAIVSTLLLNSAAIASSVSQNRFDATASSVGPNVTTIAPSCEPNSPTTTSTHLVEESKTRAEVFLCSASKSVERSERNPVNSSRIYDALDGVALECTVAPKGGYVNPGIGSAVPGQNFSHGWIKHDLYNQLNGLVGKADMNKFLAALKKGIVGPTGESGIKIFNIPIGRYTHELKIGGSAQRLLGYIDENGVLIFDKFVRGGLH